MISNVGTQCNFGKVGQFITYLVGPLPGFPMEVFDVLGLVGPLITQFRIPECYGKKLFTSTFVYILPSVLHFVLNHLIKIKFRNISQPKTL